MITFNKETINEVERKILGDKRVKEIVNKDIPFKELNEEELKKMILYKAFLIAEQLYLARESGERNAIIKEESEKLLKANKETNRLVEEAIKSMKLNNEELEIKYEQQAKQNK